VIGFPVALKMPAFAVKASASHKAPVMFSDNRSRQYPELQSPNRPGYACMNYEIEGLSREQLSRTEPDRFLMDLMRGYLKPGDQVLELGCNAGNNLLEIARRFPVKAYGLDINSNALGDLQKMAKNEGVHDKVKVATWDFAETVTLPPEWGADEQLRKRFKVIYAVHVLCHQPEGDLSRVIQGMRKYLTDDGVIISTFIDPAKHSVEDINSLPRSERRFMAKRNYLVKRNPAMLGSYTDSHAGFLEHSDEVLGRAFRGYKRELYRYFEPGEAPFWPLPEERLRWVVYRNQPENAHPEAHARQSKPLRRG
jgi:SAM-dependent methyltransferase